MAVIKIYTFGDFDVKLNNETIIETKGYPHRLIKLFKYLLTFRGKKLLPENIIEDLWADNDFKDPKNVLRTHISRVRKMIIAGEDKRDTFYNIDYVNGYYVFDLRDDCTVDFEMFYELINKGNTIKDSHPDEAMLLLEQGLSLYKGEYLPEIEYEDWIIPIRNKYHRIYLKGLLNYLELLKQRQMYQEIVNKCEEAIQYEPYGEVIHIYLIEALLEIGEKRYASSHYEYITSKLYNDLGIKPSIKMKELYKRLQIYENGSTPTITFNIINEELGKGYEEQGVLICEPYYFRFLYNLEIRKKQREIKSKVVLGIASIENRLLNPLSESDTNNAMEILIEIVCKNMRKGDVLTKWNDSQLLSLLYGVEEKDLNIIANRLKQKFEEKINNKNIILNIRHKPL